MHCFGKVWKWAGDQGLMNVSLGVPSILRAIKFVMATGLSTTHFWRRTSIAAMASRRHSLCAKAVVE